MKEAWEQNLKEKLDRATPEDVGLNFDREKLWGVIEHKSPVRRRTLWPWLSHAAAIITGIIAGAFVWSLLHQSNQSIDHSGDVALQQSVGPQSNGSIEKELAPPTPQSIPRKRLPSSQPAVTEVRTSKAGNNVLVGIDQKLQENIEQLGTDEQVNPNSEQIIIADNTPPTLRTKVLHVADLKNDGNNPITAHTSKQTSLLNTIINRQDIQNDASESVSALVVGFLKK